MDKQIIAQTDESRPKNFKTDNDDWYATMINVSTCRGSKQSILYDKNENKRKTGQ